MKGAPTLDRITALEARVATLEGVIAGALDAMDLGEYGQVRRILVTGHDRPVMATTGVIAKDMPGVA